MHACMHAYMYVSFLLFAHRGIVKTLRTCRYT